MAKNEVSSAFKSAALLLLVAQNVSLVLTMKASMGDGAVPYITTVTVFLTELLKLFICIIVVYVYQGKTFNWMSITQVEGLKMAVPAFLYVVQNNLIFFALSRLEPAVFQITYQLKIATTAILDPNQYLGMIKTTKSHHNIQYLEGAWDNSISLSAIFYPSGQEPSIFGSSDWLNQANYLRHSSNLIG